MIWTGLIPVADADPRALASLAADARMSVVIGLIARRLGEEIDERPAPVDALLAATASRTDAERSQVVAGLVAGLAGRCKARKPEAWDAFRGALARSNDRKLREDVRELDVLFGDGRALDEVRRLALDDSAGFEERKAALRTLIDGRPPDLRSVCERLVRVRFVNAVAARGLALFDDPEVGRTLARNYRSFHPSERSSAIEVLVSRPSFARALLDQVNAGKIPREDVSPFHARQIQSLADPASPGGWARSGAPCVRQQPTGGAASPISRRRSTPRRSPRPIAGAAAPCSTASAPPATACTARGGRSAPT